MRVYFRRFRITVWLIVLALLAVLIYLNRVGLPQLLKKPLLAELHSRGIDLQFSRLRLHWYEGIVADQVRFGRAAEPAGPAFTAREVVVGLDPRALAKAHLHVSSLRLREGRMSWPLVETNHPLRYLTAENISTRLRLLPGDQWALDDFKATFAGANLSLSGVITNASRLAEWRTFRATAPTPVKVWEQRLIRFADTLERIRFTATPELKLAIQGDARELQSFSLWLSATAPGAETPWGTLAQGTTRLRLFPADTNGLWHGELSLSAASAETPWANITRLDLGMRVATLAGQTNLANGELELSAGRINTRWAESSNACFSATWTHSLASAVPLHGEGSLRCDFAGTRWGGARDLKVHGLLATLAPSPQSPPPDPALGFWTNLLPYAIAWEANAAHFTATNLHATALSCGGTWHVPNLTITNLAATLYRGEFHARGDLDVVSRAAQVRLTSNFDVQQIAPVLDRGSRRWLSQFTWNQPPRVQGEVAVTLPAWTNRQPAWDAEVVPTLQLRGEFDLAGGGTYRHVHASGARSHFTYTNLCWFLPDLQITRPEGRVLATHWADDRSHDFYWKVDSTVDVNAARPMLSATALKGLDLFTFTQPPAFRGEVWGRYREDGRTGFRGHVALTNFSFRGESVTGVQTALVYTNLLLHILEPALQRGTQHMRADGLLADFNTEQLHFTNGFSTVEPMVIARCIGPQTAGVLEPYQFLQPPTGRVQGVIPLRGEKGADVYFDLEGGPFHWWKLNLAQVAGRVHWHGDHLTLSNMNADFYGGPATGSAEFDLTSRPGTDFSFWLVTTNTRLQSLMTDLFPGTKAPEGWVAANVVITSANSARLDSVQGHGRLCMRDGLLWDIPLFGVVSPILNTFTPGLGNSRATAGTCTFVMTNGVARSNDLDIRTPTMRLQYRGTVDLEGNLKARVEAELLKDVFLVGPLVSTVFWPVTKMFEYKVEGTLGAPKLEPLYLLPKILLMPFQPLRTLRGLVPEKSSTGSTNAPPANP